MINNEKNNENCNGLSFKEQQEPRRKWVKEVIAKEAKTNRPTKKLSKSEILKKYLTMCIFLTVISTFFFSCTPKATTEKFTSYMVPEHIKTKSEAQEYLDFYLYLQYYRAMKKIGVIEYYNNTEEITVDVDQEFREYLKTQKPIYQDIGMFFMRKQVDNSINNAEKSR